MKLCGWSRVLTNRIRAWRKWTVLLLVMAMSGAILLVNLYVSNPNTLLMLPSYDKLPKFTSVPAFRSTRSGNAVNVWDAECEMCDDSFVLDKDFLRNDRRVSTHGQVHKMPLFRHYTGHEPWPELQQPDLSKPGKVPATVHYLWCKQNAWLGFHHYLGLLSAIRHFQPIKFIFYYRELPVLDHDMYYTWFVELKQSLPGLVLRRLPKEAPPCFSPNMLSYALSFLQDDGGVLLGSNVIVSRVPHDIHLHPFWFAFASPWPDPKAGDSRAKPDFNMGLVIASRGFTEAEKESYKNQILALSPSPNSSSKSSPPSTQPLQRKCITPEAFDARAPDSQLNADCVAVPDRPLLYPVDIMYRNSSFAQLARWLFYGTRSPMHPKTNEGDPIPRISHLIWFSNNRAQPYQMEFYQFLTVLSALYVGGFEHVYIHGNAGFQGQWWEALKKENVTFVKLSDPELVFQQTVGNPSHKSDVTRYAILYNYGGAYQDFEAMWTSRVPDWILKYPCVATSDWVAYGDFPDGINPGVLLAKRHAPWLRYNLASHRYYVDSNFVWNAVLMSYRTYERHPDQLLYYRHLQVMCDVGICHPSWQPGFRRDINDRKPTEPFNWRNETLVVHVTRPDPEKSFLSPENLKKGKDIFSEIGRNILEKSGRLDVIN